MKLIRNTVDQSIRQHNTAVQLVAQGKTVADV